MIKYRQIRGDMEQLQTKWEELGISNDFLFGKVMLILQKLQEKFLLTKEESQKYLGR